MSKLWHLQNVSFVISRAIMILFRCFNISISVYHRCMVFVPQYIGAVYKNQQNKTYMTFTPESEY